jgi:ABC-type antimicrobial peptide transport system permease subunit
MEQFPLGDGNRYLLVSAYNDPRSTVPSLTSRLRAVAPNLALDRVRRVAETLEEGRSPTRFNTQLAATFAGLALLLSMIGVYGLTAAEVSARWRELAIRLAMGATQRTALWLAIRPCAVILVVGAAIGVLGALSIGPGLTSLLHGVTPDDPSTLMAVPIVLCAMGILAAFLAAVRVLRADPAEILRGD